jgi:RNA polymerase sporulation-specific sigma factor
MLTIDEAQELMKKLIELRAKAKETKNIIDINNFNRHERLCVEKFSYLITMKTSRYKIFNNYEDLNQEGEAGLLMAMKNYNPKKGNFFYWAHKYIQTRISRTANLHTTIRYPLKVAKDMPPHKEAIMPLLVEEKYCPDKELEEVRSKSAIVNATRFLSKMQKEVIELRFGLNGDKRMSISRICKTLDISRANCIKMINESLVIMRENIKI